MVPMAEGDVGGQADLLALGLVNEVATDVVPVVFSAAENSREDMDVALDLFAGISVSDYQRALAWYERLLGSPPTFVAHSTEAVWELAEHRFVFIEEQVEDAGHAQHTIFVDDLDTLVGQIADRGLDPVERETYSNGVRKVTYRDPDGNEIGFGGAPAARQHADEGKPPVGPASS